jgi:hypothetical protein
VSVTKLDQDWAGGPQAAAPSRGELLDHIAEMSGLLQRMALDAGCPTLAGLLALASSEARLQQTGPATDKHNR